MPAAVSFYGTPTKEAIARGIGGDPKPAEVTAKRKRWVTTISDPVAIRLQSSPG
jgi:hypothetical protein